MPLRTLCAALAAALVGHSSAQVVPNGFANTAGSSSFILTTTTNPGRRFQFQIHEDQLAGFVGQNLNGIQFRLNETATAAFPTSAITYSRFDIWIGAGVTPSSRSSTFDNNYVGTPTQVRSGGLTVDANSYSATGSPVKPFGPVIAFDNYLYNGGHLVIDLRYSGHAGVTSTFSVDACGSSNTTGYGTQFSAAWQSNPDAVTALTTTANFPVIQLSASAVPEPGTMAALGLGALALLRRRKRG